MGKRFTVTVIAIFVSVLAFDLFFDHQLTQQQKNRQMMDVSLRMAALRARLEKEITQNLLLLQGTANFISITPDLTPDQFDRYARAVMAQDNLLKNLAAAPDFRIRFIYPLKGNEKIVGVDYRNLPDQWEQARKVKEQNTLVVAGPLELIQGGWGFIGRAPVFTGNPDTQVFWGIVSAAIDVSRLFQMVQVPALADLDIAIRGIDGKGENGGVFWGSPSLFDPGAGTVRMPVTFPAGSWLMAAAPKNGWTSTHPFAFSLHGLLILFFFTALFFTYKTMRKNNEIETARQSLKQAQAIAHLGSWEMNTATQSLWWSEETCHIFGVDPAVHTPSYDHYLSAIHPEDRALVEKTYQESVKTRQPYTIDHRIVLPDGTVRHVQGQGKTAYHPDGTPLKSSGTVLDITERKQAEIALSNEEKKMRAMLEASYDAYIMIDSADRILYWSPAAEKMFGWTGREALGQKAHTLIAPPGYHDAAARGMEAFARTGQGKVLDSVMEFQVFKKNGEPFYIERTVAAFESNGKFYAVSTLRDISDRKEAENRLRSYAERISLASEAGGVGIWEWDIGTGELVWDKQMYALYSVSPDEFTGLYQAWTQRVHPDDLTDAEDELKRALDADSEWRWEFRIVLPDGHIRYIQAAARTHRDAGGKNLRMIGINLDMTEMKTAQNELEKLATTDSLTGLANRGHFMRLADAELEKSRRYGRPLSVMMIDADKFKAINDTYGHEAGDRVLQALAASFRQVVRSVDILGRIGGEEFGLILPETGVREAAAVAERLRQTVEQQAVDISRSSRVTFTVSIGVSALADRTEEMDVLLRRADEALYTAKASGRNRVEIVDTPADTGDA